MSDISAATSGQFHIGFSFLKDKDAISLAKRLHTNRSLKVLDIGNSAIGDEGAKAMARMLEVNKGLATFTFYQTGVGSPGGIALAEALKKNDTLSRIHFSVSKPSDAFASAWADTLTANKTLAELYLDSPLSSAQIQRFAQGFKHHPAMAELFITGARDEAAVQALEEAFAGSKNLIKIVTDEMEYHPGYDLSSREKVPLQSEKLQAICKRNKTEATNLLEKIDEGRLNPLDIAKAQERLPAIMMLRGDNLQAGKKILDTLQSEAGRLRTYLEIPYTYRQAYLDEAPARTSWLSGLRFGGGKQKGG